MPRNFYVSPIALSLFAMTVTHAAEPVPLEHTSFTAIKQSFQLLPALNKSSVKGSTHSLQLVRQRTDQNKMTHVRMQQHYAGFPVFRGYAIVHGSQPARTLLAASAGVNMNGVLYKGLDAELGQPDPAFVRDAAQALAKFSSQHQLAVAASGNVIPMIYIDDNNHAFWAYQVSVYVQHDDKIPERPSAILDAKTLVPFVQWNDLKTLRTRVKGEGFGGNIRTNQFHFGKDFPYLELSRDKISGMCYMENPGVKVVDMAHGYEKPNTAMRFSCKTIGPTAGVYWTGYQADGYDRENGAFSPTNDALYTGYVINQMYSEWYGLPPLTAAEKPMQLVMRVHYGKGYENAFWDGEQMTFGDGDVLMHPLVSLGVGAHEISHGFTEQHSNLVYFGQAGGMNESFSDMAAQVAEYYSSNHNSWSIGADILKKDSGYSALRFMDQPSRDGYSIDRADGYYHGLDVHYSSGVYNHLFYLLVQKPGWDTRKAFGVMLKANMDYWTPSSTFEAGGCGVISAARDLGFSVDDVKAALDDVAIKYQKCE